MGKIFHAVLATDEQDDGDDDDETAVDIYYTHF
jgi:hypothetical protein